MLNLEDLILLNENERNGFIFAINEQKVNKIDTFSNHYGALCGGSDEGLLIEESQEFLFDLSQINVMFDNGNFAILEQNNIPYTVKITIGTEGVWLPSEHYNFKTLKRIDA